MHDLDLHDLGRRVGDLARRDGSASAVSDLRRLEGGVSSLTYACIAEAPDGGRPAVLKVAPPGLAPVRNRDVLRQARMLRLLAGVSGFPVPDVLFEDAGDPPAVPPLFAMELCPGQSYEPRLDVSDRPPSPDVAAERMRVAARVLARLQDLEPATLSLADEPVAPVAEELERWARLFATVDPDIGVGHEELRARLAKRVPEGLAPRVLHGDYRLANMLFTGAKLEAVIDWEIWSIGDPRSDLAWLMMHTDPAHTFHEDRSPADELAGSALPSGTEVLGEYADARRALGATAAEVAEVTEDLGWFLGVCFYKVAATIAVIHKRDRKRSDPDPKLDVAARHLGAVLAAGHQALDT